MSGEPINKSGYIDQFPTSGTVSNNSEKPVSDESGVVCIDLKNQMPLPQPPTNTYTALSERLVKVTTLLANTDDPVVQQSLLTAVDNITEAMKNSGPINLNRAGSVDCSYPESITEEDFDQDNQQSSTIDNTTLPLDEGFEENTSTFLQPQVSDNTSSQNLKLKIEAVDKENLRERIQNPKAKNVILNGIKGKIEDWFSANSAPRFPELYSRFQTLEKITPQTEIGMNLALEEAKLILDSLTNSDKLKETPLNKNEASPSEEKSDATTPHRGQEKNTTIINTLQNAAKGKPLKGGALNYWKGKIIDQKAKLADNNGLPQNIQIMLESWESQNYTRELAELIDEALTEEINKLKPSLSQDQSTDDNLQKQEVLDSQQPQTEISSSTKISETANNQEYLNALSSALSSGKLLTGAVLTQAKNRIEKLETEARQLSLSKDEEDKINAVTSFYKDASTKDNITSSLRDKTATFLEELIGNNKTNSAIPNKATIPNNTPSSVDAADDLQSESTEDLLKDESSEVVSKDSTTDTTISNDTHSTPLVTASNETRKNPEYDNLAERSNEDTSENKIVDTVKEWDQKTENLFNLTTGQIYTTQNNGANLLRQDGQIISIKRDLAKLKALSDTADYHNLNFIITLLKAENVPGQNVERSTMSAEAFSQIIGVKDSIIKKLETGSDTEAMATEPTSAASNIASENTDTTTETPPFSEKTAKNTPTNQAEDAQQEKTSYTDELMEIASSLYKEVETKALNHIEEIEAEEFSNDKQQLSNPSPNTAVDTSQDAEQAVLPKNDIADPEQPKTKNTGLKKLKLQDFGIQEGKPWDQNKAQEEFENHMIRQGDSAQSHHKAVKELTEFYKQAEKKESSTSNNDLLKLISEAKNITEKLTSANAYRDGDKKCKELVDPILKDILQQANETEKPEIERIICTITQDSQGKTIPADSGKATPSETSFESLESISDEEAREKLETSIEVLSSFNEEDWKDSFYATTTIRQISKYHPELITPHLNKIVENLATTLQSTRSVANKHTLSAIKELASSQQENFSPFLTKELTINAIQRTSRATNKSQQKKHSAPIIGFIINKGVERGVDKLVNETLEQIKSSLNITEERWVDHLISLVDNDLKRNQSKVKSSEGDSLKLMTKGKTATLIVNQLGANKPPFYNKEIIDKLSELSKKQISRKAASVLQEHIKKMKNAELEKKPENQIDSPTIAKSTESLKTGPDNEVVPANLMPLNEGAMDKRINDEQQENDTTLFSSEEAEAENQVQTANTSQPAPTTPAITPEQAEPIIEETPLSATPLSDEIPDSSEPVLKDNTADDELIDAQTALWADESYDGFDELNSQNVMDAIHDAQANLEQAGIILPSDALDLDSLDEHSLSKELDELESSIDQIEELEATESDVIHAMHQAEENLKSFLTEEEIKAYSATKNPADTNPETMTHHDESIETSQSMSTPHQQISDQKDTDLSPIKTIEDAEQKAEEPLQVKDEDYSLIPQKQPEQSVKNKSPDETDEGINEPSYETPETDKAEHSKTSQDKARHSDDPLKAMTKEEVSNLDRIIQEAQKELDEEGFFDDIELLDVKNNNDELLISEIPEKQLSEEVTPNYSKPESISTSKASSSPQESKHSQPVKASPTATSANNKDSTARQNRTASTGRGKLKKLSKQDKKLPASKSVAPKSSPMNREGEKPFNQERKKSTSTQRINQKRAASQSKPLTRSKGSPDEKVIQKPAATSKLSTQKTTNTRRGVKQPPSRVGQQTVTPGRMPTTPRSTQEVKKASDNKTKADSNKNQPVARLKRKPVAPTVRRQQGPKGLITAKPKSLNDLIKDVYKKEGDKLPVLGTGGHSVFFGHLRKNYSNMISQASLDRLQQQPLSKKLNKILSSITAQKFDQAISKMDEKKIIASMDELKRHLSGFKELAENLGHLQEEIENKANNRARTNAKVEDNKKQQADLKVEEDKKLKAKLKEASDLKNKSTVLQRVKRASLKDGPDANKFFSQVAKMVKYEATFSTTNSKKAETEYRNSIKEAERLLALATKKAKQPVNRKNTKPRKATPQNEKHSEALAKLKAKGRARVSETNQVKNDDNDIQIFSNKPKGGPQHDG